jgi:hypothetical protein
MNGGMPRFKSVPLYGGIARLIRDPTKPRFRAGL